MQKHPTNPQVGAVPTQNATQADEALRRVTAQQIGPRRPGTVYDNTEARRVLRRHSARFAVLVRDMHAGTEYYTGATWTGSDRVLKAVA